MWSAPEHASPANRVWSSLLGKSTRKLQQTCIGTRDVCRNSRCQIVERKIRVPGSAPPHHGLRICDLLRLPGAMLASSCENFPPVASRLIRTTHARAVEGVKPFRTVLKHGLNF